MGTCWFCALRDRVKYALEWEQNIMFTLSVAAAAFPGIDSLGPQDASPVLEEITTKAAAIAIVVEGRYLTVTDMRACNAYASACHAQLRLSGDPHGGYYDEGRVWHPHVTAPAQATYGLGVGATTVVGPGGSRSRWASGSAPGAVSPGQTGSTDPTKARSPSLVQ